MALQGHIVYWRYPALRVAYVEEKEEIIGDKTRKVYSSILVKAVGKHDQVTIIFFFILIKWTIVPAILKLRMGVAPY